MIEPITVAISPAQAEEFRILAKSEAEARQTLDRCPVARTYAARAILLGTYPLAMFEGQQIHIDADSAQITFVPNASLALAAPETPQPEAVS